MASVVQQWNPDDWESISLFLLQARHGPLNIHKVPATHAGDFGIDFYCTSESVIYQCFAAEEPVDIATRAKRQKSKITTDLKKIIDGSTEVTKLLLGSAVNKWVLLVPLHDSKDVNTHCAKKTTDLRKMAHSYLSPKFEVLIQDQKHFSGQDLEKAPSKLTNVSLSVPEPTTEELNKWKSGSPELLVNATKKLSKRTAPGSVQTAVGSGVEIFLKSNALIDALRSSAPDLHEQVISAISERVRRLTYIGPQGGPAPNNIMSTELNNLENAIKLAAPNLSITNANDIALGTLSEWIMRCPLDFPPYDS